MKHVETCIRCGRALKNQPWVGIRYGKVCAGKLGIAVVESIGQAREHSKRTNERIGNYEQLSIVEEEIKKPQTLGNELAA